MTKQNVTAAMPKTKAVALRVYQIAKTAFIVFVVETSLVGTYVLANAPLRNGTIDFAQNQRTIEAASPKAK